MSGLRFATVGVAILLATVSGCSAGSAKTSTANATDSPIADASSTPTAKHAPKVTQDPPAEPAAKDSGVLITQNTIFGSGVVDILNTYDLGDSTTQLTVCRDVSAVLDGMTTTEMSRKMATMEDYDYSTLTDLVAECNALVG